MPVLRMQPDSALPSADPVAEITINASLQAASQALRAGSLAPLFTLADAGGQQVALEDLLRAGPVVLHFFRGAWCSFGEAALAEFASTYKDMAALGANAVAITPPLRGARQSARLPMRELQDVDMKVARAYGLAFELPVSLRARYEALGYEPPSTRNAGTWLAPIPATYLLDRDGIVVLAFVDVDYRKHFKPDSLLTALRALQARHSGAAHVMR